MRVKRSRGPLRGKPLELNDFIYPDMPRVCPAAGYSTAQFSTIKHRETSIHLKLTLKELLAKVLLHTVLNMEGAVPTVSS